MNPTDVLAAAAWVGSAGAVCGIIVQLMKQFAGVDSPRAKVATAAVAAVILVLAYATQSGVQILANPFTLIIAAVTVAATGAGIQSAATATVTGKTQTPPTAP